MKYDDLKNDIKTAMKEKNTTVLGVLRMLKSALVNEVVAKGGTPQDEIGDDIFIAVVKREVKKRKDSIKQFEDAGRDDLADTEKEELEILEKYMPELASREEIEKVAREIKDKENISESDKGKFIGMVVKHFAGSADGTVVKEVVEALLSE